MNQLCVPDGDLFVISIIWLTTIIVIIALASKIAVSSIDSFGEDGYGLADRLASTPDPWTQPRHPLSVEAIEIVLLASARRP